MFFLSFSSKQFHYEIVVFIGTDSDSPAEKEGEFLHANCTGPKPMVALLVIYPECVLLITEGCTPVVRHN